MIWQKTVKQRRRAVGRMECELIERRHQFDVDLNFSLSEVTAHQTEKRIFASLYVWMSGIAVALIFEQMWRIGR